MKTYHVDFFVNGEEYELDVPANKKIGRAHV